MYKFPPLAALLAVAAPALADGSFFVAPARADAPTILTLQNHKFSPNVIRIKANQPAMITMVNKDATAEEFDSSDLKVEKVVAGNQSGNIRIRALKPGTYKFMGEYHAATAQGIVIAQ
ncbi:MAG: cupredoxin domain-containing protein [Alphaproteobacteria bacterium]|nr:cupredoxin domain-containing protein [Alphaproteobacteria bacterium]